MNWPIELPLCRLRPLRPQDEDSLQRHADDPAVSAWLRDSFPSPYLMDDARMFIALQDIFTPPRVLGIEVAGEIVGCIGIELQGDVYRESAEIGYWLGRSHWRRGLLTQVLPPFCAYSFANFSIHRLYAGVFSGNLASPRLLAGAGFEVQGCQRQAIIKNGKYLDVHHYGLLRP